MFKNIIEKWNIFWLLIPLLILVLVGIWFGWNAWGWYFIIPLVVLIVIVILSTGNRYRIRRSFSGWSFRSISINWGNVLWFLVSAIAFVFLASQIYWTVRNWKSVPNTEERSAIVHVRDTRPEIYDDQYMLLQAFVPYQWNRKCKTLYYFELKNNGRGTLTYIYDNDPRQFLSGTILRNAQGPDFIPTIGQDPMKSVNTQL